LPAGVGAADGADAAAAADGGTIVKFSDEAAMHLTDPARLASTEDIYGAIEKGVEIPGLRGPNVVVFNETDFQPGLALKVIANEIPGGYFVRTFYPLALERAASELFEYGFVW